VKVGWKALLVVVASLSAGCDRAGWASVRGDERGAMELYNRVLHDDASALTVLESRAPRDSYAAFFAGLANEPAGLNAKSPQWLARANRAATYYRLAGTSRGAQHNLALLTIADGRVDPTVDTMSLLESSARAGLLESMLLLAELCSTGLAGVPRNDALAAQWYQAAVDLYKDPRGELALGVAFARGQGVTRNLSTGRMYLLAAAKDGMIPAMRYLADLETPGSSAFAQWLAIAALSDPAYQPEAEDALAQLTDAARVLAVRNAKLWLHAHQRARVLRSHKEPVITY